MKRKGKLGLSLAAIALGAVALSGCTKSFCSQVDVARMKFAFEPGISEIIQGGDEDSVVFKTEVNGNTYTYTITHAKFNVATWTMKDPLKPHIGSYILEHEDAKPNKLNYLNNIISGSRKAGLVTIDGSTKEFLMRFDYLAYNAIFEKVLKNECENITVDLSTQYAKFDHDLNYYSYARFVTNNYHSAWTNWNRFNLEARREITSDSPLYGVSLFDGNHEELSPDVCPSTDYIKYYKSQLNGYVANYRTCLTTKTDKYGTYGYSADNGIYIQGKTWGEAWSKGLFEGLLVYPIGWLIDVIVTGFKGTGATPGAAALLGIVFVTFIIRSLMLLVTFKQTKSNAKMTELQPEVQKIQNKYPNANTSQAEKQRMAEEMNRLYKKNKVNPFTTLIVLIVQFPVFICVWGALSGSAALTNGTVLNLNLSYTIKDVLFNKAAWSAASGMPAAVAALLLFLLMAAAQTISMLLPQWIQKRKAKDVAKLGKNPAQKSQSNKMKWFTYIMLAIIIFMGFTLASAMGIYWFIGAVFSIVQTIVMQAVMNRKKKN